MSPNLFTEPLLNLFRQDVPLLDVRAPVEFAEGSFPHAQNIPILDNEQRHLIGLHYREQGQEEAIKRGHELVSGLDKEQKITRWMDFFARNPRGVLYCFRGGLRSQITQSWLLDQGLKIPLVPGGYKALRKALIDHLEEQIQKNDFLVIGGYTGSGKTKVIQELRQQLHSVLDLENIANHRGSVFGQKINGQPTQIHFENMLSIEFLKLANFANRDTQKILIEDEGPLIGRLVLPLTLLQKKCRSPLFVLEAPLEERIELIFQDYILQMSYVTSEEDFSAFFLKAFAALKKKIGGALYNECLSLFSQAVTRQNKWGDYSLHQDWIRKLLFHYYDPLYEKGLKMNANKNLIVGRGNKQNFESFLRINFPSST